MEHQATGHYDKIRRASKVPNSQRKNLLDFILIDGLSIRQAAIKARMNYSTAKVFFRKYQADNDFIYQGQEKQSDQQYRISKRSKQYHLMIPKIKENRCSYVQKVSMQNKEGSESTESQKKTNKIQIISTLGWDFMNNGLPSLY